MKQFVFKLSDFHKYVVTGSYYNSDRKFRMESSSWYHVAQINLWRGRVWGVKPNGQRVLLKRVWN